MVKTLLKTTLLLCALMAGSGSVWATDVTFTFNTDTGIKELGIDKPTSGNGTNLYTNKSYTLNDVSFSVTHGSTNTRVWNSSGTLDLRVYNGGSLSFTAPGNITKIVLAGNTVNGFSANVGTFKSDTWTGDASSVTLTATGTEKINTITVTYDSRSANTITVTGGTEFTIDRTQDEEDLTLTATATSQTPVTFTVDTENTTVPSANYDLDDNYLLVSGTKGGVIIIKANAVGNETYKDADEVTITVTVVGEKANPIIAVADANVAYGSTFTVDDTTIEGGTITVASGNTNVATVEGMVITPVAVGTATITVSTAADNDYNAGSETFVLTVTAPEGQTTAKPVSGDVALFHESFGDNSGSARDWNDSYSVKSGIEAVYAGIVGYAVTNAKQGKNTTGSTKSGLNQITAGTDASIIIGPLNVANYKNMTLTYQWKAVSVKGTYSTSAFYATSATGEYTELTGTGDGATTFVERSYSLPAAAQVSTLYLKIVWNTSNTQAIIDEVNLSGSASATETTTLNSYGFATFCSQYPLDFSEATDYTAWQITDIDSDNKITFTQITGSVKGGTGIFLKGEADATVTLTSADSENTLSGNLLEGTLAPTYVASGEYYGLSGDSFVKVNAGTVKAGKAILNSDWITEGAGSRFTFVFADEASGISETEIGALNADNAIYNLNGQRVSAGASSVPARLRGLYIVNGKKVVMK